MNQGRRPVTPEQLHITLASGAITPSRHKRQWQFFLRRRSRLLMALTLLLLWLAGVMIYQTHKPLPPGLSAESPAYKVNTVAFWHDLTYQDNSGKQAREEQILPRILQIIEESRQFLVIDLFLFNNYTHTDQQFPLSADSLPISCLPRKPPILRWRSSSSPMR